MSKSKFDFSSVFSIIKCSLFGVVFTLIGTIALAVVLKFVDIPMNIIDYINNAVKGISIFLMIMCVKKGSENGLFIRAILTAILYSILTFVIFSLLNGGFVLDMSVIFDLLFAMIVSIISAVIINVFKKRTV